MSFSEAIKFLIKNSIDKNLKGIACAALGSDEPFIRYDTLENLEKIETKKIPRCLIIPGNLHFIEKEMLNIYS